MDFACSAEEERFRAEIRDFMRENALHGYSGIVTTTFLSRDEQLLWERKLGQKGWLAYHWPREFGGPGWTAMQREIFEQERALAGSAALSEFGVHMLGPVLMKFGTREQQERFLPRVAAADEIWCQGYSEPGAGSDLASLKTRAERRADRYVVNGQKIWTTHAHYADWMFCLARTSAEASRQQGISFLLIDMRSRGVEVRPIMTIDGHHHVNEVFLTDVEVPISQRVAEEGEGWAVAKYLLTHERSSLVGVSDSKQQLALLRKAVEAHPVLGADPVAHRRLDELEVDLLALEITNLRTVDRMSRGEAPGPESSGLKIKGTELEQLIAEAQLEMGGLDALPWQSLAHGDGLFSRASRRYNYLRAASIYGGSNEIQRNVLAKTFFRL